MRVLTVVGARPQFIKAAPVSRALEAAGHEEILVHTGQHYDEGMSVAHFRDCGLSEPAVNLQIGSGPHGAQTGRMLGGLETVMTERAPDWVLVYGDTNSTLAGALAAAKLAIPLAHVEAGQRSHKRTMPEEINRIVADHLSSVLLCATPGAVDNLAREGIVGGVHLVGDVMLDSLAWMLRPEQAPTNVLRRLRLKANGYLLATVHRAENTDDLARLRAILSAFNELDETIVLPIHPRTSKMLSLLDWIPEPQVRLIEPVGYRDMVELERGARMILTDSGGVQKEAYLLGVPCVMLRDETEWVELVEAGWGVLVGASRERILAAVRSLRAPVTRPPLYGDGHAAVRCVSIMEQCHVR